MRHLAVEVFDENAQAYEDQFMAVNAYRVGFDFLCEQLPTNTAVLELGCGPGNIINYLSRRRPDFKILGTDLSPNMLRLAERNNPSARFQLLDCRDILNLEETVDAIVCGFCLPYLDKSDALQLIADCARLLTPAGLIYISTMEGDYEKSALKTTSSGASIFVHYHQADYLTEALKHNDFKVLSVQRQDYSTDVTDLILIARLTP
jgi:SAM-dependent methyltransferase